MLGLAVIGMCLGPVGGLEMVECVCVETGGEGGTILCPFNHGVYLLPPCCDFFVHGRNK